MKTNAVDLRRNMKDILRAIERNERVTVLYHGKEKAVIVPIEQPSKQVIEHHNFFGMLDDNEPVETVMEGLRGGRY